MRGALIHGVLLVVMLIYGYRTWTRDKTVQPNVGSVVLWDKAEADIQSIEYKSERKIVKLEHRADYWWGTDTTIELRPKKKEEPAAAGSGAGSGSAAGSAAGSAVAQGSNAGSAKGSGAGSGSAAKPAPPEMEEVGRKTRAPAFDLEVPLVPERRLALGLCRLQRIGDVLDQVAVDADEPGAALGPERCTDAGRAPAPIIAREYRARNRQRIHQRHQVRTDRRLLTGTHCRLVEEPRRAIAAQIGHDGAAALLRQNRRDVDIGVDVIGKAVQQHHGRAIRGTRLVIADIEHAGIGMTERLEALRGRRTRRHDCNSRTVLTRC